MGAPKDIAPCFADAAQSALFEDALSTYASSFDRPYIAIMDQAKRFTNLALLSDEEAAPLILEMTAVLNRIRGAAIERAAKQLLGELVRGDAEVH